MLARPDWRDRAGLAFFAALAIVAIGSLYEPSPASALGSPNLPPLVESLKDISPPAALWCLSLLELVKAVSREMASYYLLPALGMLVALRRGAIDLSVWAVCGFGGLVAAGLINAGLPPLAAMILAGVVGTGVGLVNGMLTSVVKIPSFIATLVVGAVLVGVMRVGWPGGQVRIPDYAFGNLLATPSATLLTTRMLVVGCVYAVVMLAMMVGGWSLWQRSVPGNRLSRSGPSLVLAMCVSGGLCAIGGVVSVMDQGVAPVIKWPIEDLRIPLAAIIAGGAFWAGPGRSLLAGACLPAALLIAVVWWEDGPQFTLGGFELQIVLLGLMVIATQMAIARATSSRFGDAYCKAAAALTACGTVAVAAAVYYPISVHASLVAVTAGVGVWLLGVIIMMIARSRGGIAGGRA
jgi:predicted ABC-type sugar transport system permease subunit